MQGFTYFSFTNFFRNLISMRSDSILFKILLSPLTLLSYIFLLAIIIRRFFYRTGLFRTRSLNCQVISIGNLTIGGTGKTPFAIFLAEGLRRRGRSVALITRGYKGRSKGPVSLVSDKERIFLPPSDAGDEAFLMASRLKGIPVIIGKDRYLAGEYTARTFKVDTLILDDGFQHLSLRKDIEILLIDATDPAGNGFLLPRGTLREPLSAIGRSSAVVLTRTDQAEALDPIVKNIKKYSDSNNIFITRFEPVGLMEIRSGSEEGIGYIKGKRLLLFSGIGNPGSFRKMIERSGGLVIREIIFPDHHNYLIRELEQIELFASRNNIDLIITTEKDGVKLAEIPFGYLPIWALRIDLIMDDRIKLEEMILGTETAVAS